MASLMILRQKQTLLEKMQSISWTELRIAAFPNDKSRQVNSKKGGMGASVGFEATVTSPTVVVLWFAVLARVARRHLRT